MSKIICVYLKELVADRHQTQFMDHAKSETHTRAHDYIAGEDGIVEGNISTKSPSTEHGFILETACFDSAGMRLERVKTLEAA
jgi:hypothetical protein